MQVRSFAGVGALLVAGCLAGCQGQPARDEQAAVSSDIQPAESASAEAAQAPSPAPPGIRPRIGGGEPAMPLSPGLVTADSNPKRFTVLVVLDEPVTSPTVATLDFYVKDSKDNVHNFEDVGTAYCCNAVYNSQTGILLATGACFFTFDIVIHESEKLPKDADLASCVYTINFGKGPAKGGFVIDLP